MGFRNSLMNTGGLGQTHYPAPQMRGSLSGFDGVDTSYSFNIYDVEAAPAGVNAVYMFCRIEGRTYVPVYIGRAEILSDRLCSHERRAEAIRLGAVALLVHTPPAIGARVDYITAERRLIAHYNPALNTQHRTRGPGW
jgi:hypothetical protein